MTSKSEHAQSPSGFEMPEWINELMEAGIVWNAPDENVTAKFFILGTVDTYLSVENTESNGTSYRITSAGEDTPVIETSDTDALLLSIGNIVADIKRGEGLIGLPDGDLLELWGRLGDAFPGLHPDEWDNPAGGWPEHLKVVAAEAFRRFEDGRLSDGELYWAESLEKYIAAVMRDEDGRLPNA